MVVEVWWPKAVDGGQRQCLGVGGTGIGRGWWLICVREN
jgi:hypothetical protein